MADVCIIYSRKDAAHLPPVLEKLLSPEFSVWWDKKINDGDYREEILRQLRKAGCVVAIWSPAVSGSMTLDEAQYSKDLQIPLLPILTHSGNAPLGFGTYEMTKAVGWGGERDHPAIPDLVGKIRHAVTRRRGPKPRPTCLVSGKAVKLPAYFFSLSSYETKVSPNQGIRALEALRVNSVLVSAQDTAEMSSRTRFISTLKRISRSGGLVLLDSGNYEEGRVSKWHTRVASTTNSKNEPQWTLEQYHAALAQTPHDMAFCFDSIKPPPNDPNKIVASAVRAVTRDLDHSKRPVLPIVHLPYDSKGNVRTCHAPEVMVRVAQSLDSPMIGIPERELGAGIVARTTTMKKIRSALNELYQYQPVHILGTGDPISIALLSAAGADSFDGLEWCRFAIDSESKRLYPIQDYDFFRWQDETSPYRSAMATDEGVEDLTWLGGMAVHNIEFYKNWTVELRQALTNDKRLVEFMTNLLPKGGMSDIWSLWEQEK